MELALTEEGGVLVAVANGPLDEAAHGPFRDVLHPLFAQRGVNLIVDLAGSKRVNSEGISALVRLVTDANTRAGRIILAAPSPFVREVFQLTRLDNFFEVAATREQAHQMLGKDVAEEA